MRHCGEMRPGRPPRILLHSLTWRSDQWKILQCVQAEEQHEELTKVRWETYQGKMGWRKDRGRLLFDDVMTRHIAGPLCGESTGQRASNVEL